MKTAITLGTWMVLSLGAMPALADVDLVTIPTRDGAQLTIYNPEVLLFYFMLR